MSRRETLESIYDVYNRAAWEEADIPEDFVYHSLPQTPHPEPIVGREALLEFLKPDLFKRQWVEVRELTESGDFVLVAIRGGGESFSGATLEQAGYQVWRFEGDVPRESWIFNDRDDAERAAGLRD